ncbi:MAG: C40 family peptidase [Vicinamibacterales bacterium]
MAQFLLRGTTLLLLLASLSAACATSGAVPSPFPRPGASGRAPTVIVDPTTSPVPVVSTALSFQGVPYRNGGADPAGFDCSGLVAYVFAQHGLFLPRTAAEQFGLGRRVSRGAVEPGDLVFFTTIAPGPSHVGIVISPGEFVHAPSSSGVVRVEPLGASYWASRFLGARRLF